MLSISKWILLFIINCVIQSKYFPEYFLKVKIKLHVFISNKICNYKLEAQVSLYRSPDINKSS